MKRAIQFGAGNIGRGFIGYLLHNAGYHLIFADVAENIIQAVNTKKEYAIHIKDTDSKVLTVDNISAVDSRSSGIKNEIIRASLITTAVGFSVLKKIAPVIAEGIKARKAHGITEPLNIIACENAVQASSMLKKAVMAVLNSDEIVYAEKYAGFPDCSVDRIVPPAVHENILDVTVEAFYEWNVEKDGFKGSIPQIAGMNVRNNLQAYIERKLFTLNTGHAATAYLGMLKGYARIDESIRDERIETIVRAAMQESGSGLIKIFGFDKEEHHAYIEKIINRFKNPYLQDDVKRVGREPIRKLSPQERFIKPLTTACCFQYPVDNLITGIAAALHFDTETDPQSILLQKMIQEKGVIPAFKEISGIDQHDILVKIEAEYEQLAI